MNIYLPSDPQARHTIEWTTTTTATYRAEFTRAELAAALGLRAADLAPDHLHATHDGIQALLTRHTPDAENLDSIVEYDIDDVCPDIDDPDEAPAAQREQDTERLAGTLREVGIGGPVIDYASALQDADPTAVLTLIGALSMLVVGHTVPCGRAGDRS